MIHLLTDSGGAAGPAWHCWRRPDALAWGQGTLRVPLGEQDKAGPAWPSTLAQAPALRAMGQLLGTRRAGGLTDSQGLRVSGQVKGRAHQPASRDAPRSASVHKLSDGVPSRGDSAGTPPHPPHPGPWCGWL